MNDAERGPRVRAVAPGQVIAGKYRIERQLGAGGMGIVLAASDIKLRRKVAIKAMAPALAADEHSVRRFLREARAAVALNGEHTVRVFEVGELPSGIPYMAMEFLVGRDLESLLVERGRLLFREAVDLVLQAIEGIAEAHAAGIIHRDLKPANLFLTRRSDGSQLVKVLDFGLAKAAPTPDETKLTATNAVMGTQYYMSPEQLRGSRDVDTRTDIWALGVCLYQLTTGVLPFDPTVPADRNLGRAVFVGDLARLIVSGTPRAPHDVVTEVPFGLSRVILRCLEKDPARRFANVAELATALEDHASAEFLGIGEKLHVVLEGETRQRHAVAPTKADAAVTEAESSSERTTEKMDRPLPRPYVAAAQELLRDWIANARSLLARVQIGRLRPYVSELRRDRRSILMIVATAIFLGLTVVLVMVTVNAHAGRVETAPSPTATSSAASSALGASELPPVPAVPTDTSAPRAEEPEPTASTEPVDVPEADAEVSGSRAVAPPPHPAPPRASAPRPSTTATPPPRKSNCNPPYVKHENGKVEWKVECL